MCKTQDWLSLKLNKEGCVVATHILAWLLIHNISITFNPGKGPSGVISLIHFFLPSTTLYTSTVQAILPF